MHVSMIKKKPSAPVRPATAQQLPTKHMLTKLLWVIGPAFTRWAESHMHAKGLTPQRVRILCPLMEDGPMMMSALRDELGVSATNITALVDALEKDKMVTRKPHATDRRATLIAITPKAEKIMTENYDTFRNRVGELFSGFGKAKEEQLLALLMEVRMALIERHVLEDCDLDHCAVEKKKPS
jgi:DNA-binding MarR family transcriptional regulator